LDPINETFRSRRYDLAVDTITEGDINELIEWLKLYPRLTMADATRKFEEDWSKWLGVKYSVFCNSGSSANLLMYAALDSSGKSGNKKVIVPSVGWVTTVAPAIQFGWEPAMCESDAQTFGLDIEHLKTLLESGKVDNVILVHVLGTPCRMDEILTLQKKYGFKLMEDCCAAHGALSQGRKVGSMGDMSSFSFYYGHHMSTIEGGMVCTNDEELYHHLLMLRSHGWCKDLPKAEYDRRMQQYGIDPFHSPFTFVVPGFNVRPMDLTARIGMMQLPRLDNISSIRMKNHKLYQKLLDGQVEFARCLEGDAISSISFGAVAQSPEQRKNIVSALVENNIDTRIFSAGNLGRHPFWFERYGVFSAPMADRIHSCGFFLPNNQTLDEKNIRFICDVVCRALK